MNESTFAPGGGQAGVPVRGQGPAGLEAVGSVAVRTFANHQHMTTPPKSMDGLDVNSMAGDRSGDRRGASNLPR